jgi:hypothetical protein
VCATKEVAGEREKGEWALDVRGVEDSDDEGDEGGDNSSDDDGLAMDRAATLGGGVAVGM